MGTSSSKQSRSRSQDRRRENKPIEPEYDAKAIWKAEEKVEQRRTREIAAKLKLREQAEKKRYREGKKAEQAERRARLNLIID